MLAWFQTVTSASAQSDAAERPQQPRLMPTPANPAVPHAEAVESHRERGVKWFSWSRTQLVMVVIADWFDCRFDSYPVEVVGHLDQWDQRSGAQPHTNCTTRTLARSKWYSGSGNRNSHRA